MPPSPVGVHTVFEALAYATGFRVFLWTRKRTAPQALRGNDKVVIIATFATQPHVHSTVSLITIGKTS